MDSLYPKFLTDEQQYEQAQALWHDRWQSLIRSDARHGLWMTPWLSTTFADGTPCHDGNPIFSAVCPSLHLGVRVIQLEPSGEPRELTFWIDTFGEGGEAVKELVISCALTAETLRDALNLMSQWITQKEVRLTG